MTILFNFSSFNSRSGSLYNKITMMLAEFSEEESSSSSSGDDDDDDDADDFPKVATIIKCRKRSSSS